MAEGLCRHFQADRIDAYSAGIEKHGLNPLAVQVMREIGIDISYQRSKTVLDVGDRKFDYVITVCRHANDACPVFLSGSKTVHQGFDNPPELAANAKTEQEALSHYRRVRDEIKDFVLNLPSVLNAESAG
jgi:arsenate reductase